MFERFDFSALDDPTFKEDAVREEIVAPILKRVGYTPTGPYRVTRSKNLVHPFVMIGSKRYPVKIVPDYTLYSDSEVLMVLDAKGPNEPIVNSHHVEQAYSYAIHPDIRSGHYGLCNGHDLIVYAVNKWEPTLRLRIKDVDARWDDVLKALHPRYLLNPEFRSFLLDYGLAVTKLGVEQNAIFLFPDFWLHHIARVRDDLYCGNATLMMGENEYMVSFDLSVEMYDALLNDLPHEVGQAIRQSLTRAPYHALFGNSIIVTCVGYLGQVTQGEHEQFVPITVTSVSNASFDYTAEIPPLSERQGQWPLIHLHQHGRNTLK